MSFVDEESGQHTNTIEGLWRHLKASIPEYNRRKSFFNGYVQKFIFLRWCRSNSTAPFEEFLRFAGRMYSPVNEVQNITAIGSVESDLDEDTDCESLPVSEDEGDEYNL